MFDIYEEESEGQTTKARVVRNEAGEEARRLVSHNDGFKLYSKYLIPMNNQMNKQMQKSDLSSFFKGKRKCTVPKR